MANFDLAMSKASALEGGYVDDPNDPGGATNHGVSLRWLATLHDLKGGHQEGDLNGDGVIDIEDVRSMTPDEATALYKAQWWDKYRYGDITDQAIGTKVFCTAINMGAGPANRLLQRALRAHGCSNLIEDGQLGPATMQALRYVCAKESPLAVLSTYRALQAAYYEALISHNPKLAKFRNGWLNRAYG